MSGFLNRIWYMRSETAVPPFSSAGTVDFTTSIVFSLSASAIRHLPFLHRGDSGRMRTYKRMAARVVPPLPLLSARATIDCLEPFRADHLYRHARRTPRINDFALRRKSKSVRLNDA